MKMFTIRRKAPILIFKKDENGHLHKVKVNRVEEEFSILGDYILSDVVRRNNYPKETEKWDELAIYAVMTFMKEEINKCGSFSTQACILQDISIRYNAVIDIAQCFPKHESLKGCIAVIPEEYISLMTK